MDLLRVNLATHEIHRAGSHAPQRRLHARLVPMRRPNPTQLPCDGRGRFSHCHRNSRRGRDQSTEKGGSDPGVRRLLQHPSAPGRSEAGDLRRVYVRSNVVYWLEHYRLPVTDSLVDKLLARAKETPHVPSDKGILSTRQGSQHREQGNQAHKIPPDYVGEEPFCRGLQPRTYLLLAKRYRLSLSLHGNVPLGNEAWLIVP